MPVSAIFYGENLPRIMAAISIVYPRKNALSITTYRVAINSAPMPTIPCLERALDNQLIRDGDEYFAPLLDRINNDFL